MMRLVQLRDPEGSRSVCALGDDDVARRLSADSIHALATDAINAAVPLAEIVAERSTGHIVDLREAAHDGRLLPAIDHPDPAHLHLTGTGLTHLGSAQGRDQMHKSAAGGAMTDSMRMFLMGVEGGKPESGATGAQPEWFYKGDGSCLVGPGQALSSPDFALDGSEEPEIAGIYLIDAEGQPRPRLRARQRVFRPCHRARQLSVARPFQAAPRRPRRRAAARPTARRHQGHQPDTARRPAAMGEAIPVRRGEHVAQHRQSRASSFQISAVSTSRRRACPLLRHRHFVLRHYQQLTQLVRLHRK